MKAITINTANMVK